MSKIYFVSTLLFSIVMTFANSAFASDTWIYTYDCSQCAITGQATLTHFACQDQDHNPQPYAACTDPRPVKSGACSDIRACRYAGTPPAPVPTPTPTPTPAPAPKPVVTYHWQESAFGICSATACGTSGTETRTVQCLNNSYAVVADSFCAGTKPATSQTCQAVACTTPVPPATPTACHVNDASDIPGYTRDCYGNVSYSYNQNFTYSGPYNSLDAIMGGIPYPYSGKGGILGQSIILNLPKTQYVSFYFVAHASGSLKFTTNPSWGDGGTISVSTVPGQFVKGNPAVLCTQGYGGSNNLMLTDNGFRSASCKLTEGQGYYLNMVDVFSGVPACAKQSCNMSYTILRLN